MPENATDQVLVEARSETEVLESAVAEVANFVNIPEARLAKLKQRLPLKLGESTRFNKASFGVDQGEQSPVGVISFKYKADLYEESEEAKEATFEEVTHYLHVSANESFTDGFSESRRLFLKDEAMRAMSIDQPLVEYERATSAAISELDNFAGRINIKKTHAPETPAEIERAIKILAGEFDRGVFGESYLSAGQSLRIIHNLESLLGKNADLPDAERSKEEFWQYADALVRISDNPEQLIIEGKISAVQDRKMEAERSVKLLLARHVEAALKKPENIAVLYRAFQASGVSIDSIQFRSEVIRTQLRSMSQEDAKECMLKILDSDPTTDEILHLSGAIPGAWVENMNIIGGLDPEKGRENTEKVEQMRTGLSNKIREIAIKDMYDDPRKTLESLISKLQRVASTTATIEANLIFLMDDFPLEAENRKKLLSNSQFVDAYLKATLEALGSGDYTPMNVQLNPSEFAKSALGAEALALQTLGVSFEKPDEVAFFQDLAADAAYYRKAGSSPDQLREYANRQLDMQLIKDGIDLSINLNDEVMQSIVGRAKAESLEYIRLKQQRNRHRHLMDITVEPIAKVIVAQRLGRGREEIVFPDNMLGGYSRLLRSDSFGGWVDTLWRFVEKVRADEVGGGKAMVDFFECKTVSDQRDMVTKYLSK